MVLCWEAWRLHDKNWATNPSFFMLPWNLAKLAKWTRQDFQLYRQFSPRIVRHPLKKYDLSYSQCSLYHQSKLAHTNEHHKPVSTDNIFSGTTTEKQSKYIPNRFSVGITPISLLRVSIWMYQFNCNRLVELMKLVHI